MNGKLLMAMGIGLALSLGGTALAAPAETAPDVTTLPAAAASPFVWSATKAEDGGITLAGDVPNADTRDTLIDGVDKLTADTTTVTGGAPADFAANAVAALDLLGDLDTGTVRFDGTGWSVSGAVDSADKARAAQAAFDASVLKTANAGYDVKAPAAAAATAPATPAAPAAYAWSAEKTADGAVTFTGTVPNDGLKAMLATHAGGKADEMADRILIRRCREMQHHLPDAVRILERRHRDLAGIEAFLQHIDDAPRPTFVADGEGGAGALRCNRGHEGKGSCGASCSHAVHRQFKGFPPLTG